MQGVHTKGTNEPARSCFRAKHGIGHEFPVPSHRAHLINLHGLAQFSPVLVYVKGVASSFCVLTQCKYVKREKFIDRMRHKGSSGKGEAWRGTLQEYFRK
ncbi:hypothetical protein B0G75_10324 [Paraburkholderia sp. BL18I3N2]|nr:hypothetical protein B0G75_10324 [Paraburkholderia sp. BL18I3N2]